MSRVIGTAILRLADSDIVPFEFGSTATTLAGYVDEIQKLAADAKADVDLKPLRKSIDELRSAAGKYEAALGKARPAAAAGDAALAELNRTLYLSERAFRYEAGLPRRDWFKHLAYAPGFYTGYGVKTLPGIREGDRAEAVGRGAAVRANRERSRRSPARRRRQGDGAAVADAAQVVSS